MDTDDQDENMLSEVRTLSLLADLAIALQDQGDDHTYARNYDVPQILDEQCLIVKEKDHNYSTCSRTELRGRAKYNMKRSSSEENLTTLCTSENTKSSIDDFSLISKKSHSCEQVVSTSTNPHTSNLILTDVNDELSSTSKLCSSWPNENTFKDFMIDSVSLKNLSTDILLNEQSVCDHTYARDNNSVIHEKDISNNETNAGSNRLFHKEHNYDIRGKFSFNDPHKINMKKSKQITKCHFNMIKNGKLQQEKVGEQTLSQLMKGNRLNFDHNYTYRTVQYHQPSGSVESLDMDLSESETDSCEETEQEEIKLYKQMINTQKDHPYSKSGILSY